MDNGERRQRHRERRGEDPPVIPRPGSGPGRPQRDRRPRRNAEGRGAAAVRVVAVVASAAVVVASGVAWATLRDLTGGLTTSNALAGGSASQDGSVNILLIGLDSRKDQNGNDLPPAILDQLHAGDGSVGGYNTNTLILVHIPADGARVSAFSIPRDDYVPVAGIPNNDHVKIKEAYGLKKAATEDAMAKSGVTDQHTLESAGREAGRRETVQTVQDFLGVPIDHFAEVTLAGFYDLASALGGVPVCLNHAVNDSYSGADFPAGQQTLNGAQSLAFVRQRHGLTNGDLDRTHRQQAFLASVTHKLASAGTFTNFGQLQSLLDVAKKDVVISAGWDIPTFIRQAGNLTGGNVQFATLPIERFDTVDGQQVNIVDPVAVRRQVQVAFGLQPAPAPPPPAASVTASLGGHRERPQRGRCPWFGVHRFRRPDRWRLHRGNGRQQQPTRDRCHLRCRSPGAGGGDRWAAWGPDGHRRCRSAHLHRQRGVGHRLHPADRPRPASQAAGRAHRAGAAPVFSLHHPARLGGRGPARPAGVRQRHSLRRLTATGR